MTLPLPLPCRSASALFAALWLAACAGMPVSLVHTVPPSHPPAASSGIPEPGDVSPRKPH